jgi:hypothetical protein
MKRNLHAILLVALMGTAGVMSSCKKDDMETIVLKRDGRLNITIKNGETPVADTKVRFYNEDSGNEIDVLVTDANGFVDFGQLNEGTYAISVEVLSPKYTRINQEIQVISGQTIKKDIQVADYMGTYTVALNDDDTEDVVKEDVGLGIAVVPYNDAYERITSMKEVIGLATEIKYFETAGEVIFDLPTAAYNVFVVRGDSVVSTIDGISIDKLEDRFERYYIDVNREKLKNQASWSVVTAVDELGGAIANFPVSSFKFFTNEGNRYEILLTNGVVFSGSFGFYGNYIDIGTKSSDNNDFYYYINDIEYNFDAQGNLVLYLSYLQITDSVGDNDFSEYDFSVTLN